MACFQLTAAREGTWFCGNTPEIKGTVSADNNFYNCFRQRFRNLVRIKLPESPWKWPMNNREWDYGEVREEVSLSLFHGCWIDKRAPAHWYGNPITKLVRPVGVIICSNLVYPTRWFDSGGISSSELADLVYDAILAPPDIIKLSSVTKHLAMI